MRALSLALALAVPASVLAQAPADSHVRVAPSTGGGSASQILTRRLTNARLNQLLADLRRNPMVLFDGRLIAQARRDPMLAELLRGFQNTNPEMLKLAEELSRSQGLNAEELRSRLTELAGQLLPHELNLTGSLPPGGMPSISLDRFALNERERVARQMYAEQINDLLRDMKLEGMAQELRESPAFRDLLQDMARTGTRLFEPVPGFMNSTLDLAGLGRWLSDLRQRMPTDLPSLPRVRSRGPSISGRLPELSFGRPSVPSFSGTSSAWTPVAGVVVVILAAVLAWRLLGRRSVTSTEDGIPLEPADLDQVGSWPELVRAYEWVAYRRLGPAAVHWHHRRVAAALPGGGPDADLLSRLYEAARYAPAATPPPTWEPVRAALRRLSGDRS
jgi:hypothetical protein